MAEGLSLALQESLDAGIRQLIKQEQQDPANHKAAAVQPLKEYLKKQRDSLATTTVGSSTEDDASSSGSTGDDSSSSNSSSTGMPAATMTPVEEQIGRLVTQGTQLVCRSMLAAASRL